MSDEDIHETPATFRPAHLPIISFPTPFQSEESTCESDSPFDTESLSHTSTPTTPSTPSTYLGTYFSYIGLSSQTSEEQVFATPSKPKRKRYVRKLKYNLQKGNTLAVKHKFTGQESAKVALPSSYFYKDLRFEKERETFDVKIYSDGKYYQKELKPASCNQIMILANSAQVINQLNCPDRACRGSLHLYEHLLQDGLQKFLLLKFSMSHEVDAEFPASSPIGFPAKSCVNNNSLCPWSKRIERTLRPRCTQNISKLGGFQTNMLYT